MTDTAALTSGQPGRPPATPQTRWLPRLLRDTTFRRYFSAQTVSMFGDEVTVLAIPLLAVLAVGAGPAEMGFLTAARLLPNLLFSLIAGAWADRYPDKRRIMIVADLGRAALLLAVPVMWWTDTLTLPWLAVISFGIGTLAVFFEVAHASLFASLVARPDYIDASALLNGSRAVSYVAGPSAGGFLVQVLTAPVALIADVVSYLVSALLLARIKPVEHTVSAGRGLGIGAGLRFVARSPILRALLLGTSTLNLFNYMFAALFVLYVTTELGISPATLGLIIGAGAAGALLGATLTGRLSRRFGIGRTLVAGFITFTAPLMLVPLAGGDHMVLVATLFAAEVLSAFGVMMLDITAGSVQIAATPRSMLSFVQGAERTVNYGIRPIGAVIGGALGTAIGIRPSLWIATAGAMLGLIWIFLSPVAAVHDLPEEGDLA